MTYNRVITAVLIGMLAFAAGMALAGGEKEVKEIQEIIREAIKTVKGGK